MSNSKDAIGAQLESLEQAENCSSPRDQFADLSLSTGDKENNGLGFCVNRSQQMMISTSKSQLHLSTAKLQKSENFQPVKIQRTTPKLKIL